MKSRTLFLFSSPLQFMFCCLIVQKQFDQDTVYGYYYVYGKDFRDIYGRIANKLNVFNIKIEPIESLPTDIGPGDRVFFGNRYNQNEVKTYYENLGKTKHLYLYEEGFNTYLQHHFNNPKINDKDLLLKLKNGIKRLVGKTPSHLYLNQFNKVFTTFQLEHLANQERGERIEFIGHEFQNKDNGGSCVFLLQSLVEDGLMDKQNFITLHKQIMDMLYSRYTKVYLKAHPRNSKHTLNDISLISERIVPFPQEYSDLPVELFLSKNNLDVVGFSSSTLMYSTSLFGLNSYHCMEMAVALDHNPKLRTLKASVDQLFRLHGVKPLASEVQ